MDWKKLELEDREIIQNYLDGKFETSDLNFGNIFLWSISENIEYKLKSNILYIRGNYEGNNYYFCPVSKEDKKEDIINAIKEIKDENKEIVFIPEKYAEFLKDEFELIEKRDSFDYIYLQEDLAELKGRKFSSKKNKINKFVRSYDYTYEKISKENIEEVRAFQNEWIKNRMQDRIIISENMGIQSLLDNYEMLNLRGGIIKVKGKIVAYAFGEKLTSDVGVIHIEKGDSEYQGSYQMINKYVAKEEFFDVKYINREDDFGSEGLREAKLSYQPIKLLKKYNI
ncbi:MAG: phosphatidylglycerol lysyltransferase domain-containing protein [Cetobacterium sp.]|uniref:DUF2156 domain-containing protein n=1 Tax=Cetobacterium sp. TaxID=2071632 RepID=UPI002FC6A401